MSGVSVLHHPKVIAQMVCMRFPKVFRRVACTLGRFPYFSLDWWIAREVHGHKTFGCPFSSLASTYFRKLRIRKLLCCIRSRSEIFRGICCVAFLHARMHVAWQLLFVWLEYSSNIEKISGFPRSSFL